MDASKAGASDHSRETTTVLQTTAKSSLAKYETLKHHPNIPLVSFSAGCLGHYHIDLINDSSLAIVMGMSEQFEKSPPFLRGSYHLLFV